MGSSESKLKSNEGTTRSQLNSTPSTPIKCPEINSEDVSHLDPRSPSDDIFRTPIEISVVSNDKVISHLKHVVDPRSPSDQIERTPIIIKENPSQNPRKLHNKILDNARRNISYSPTLSTKTNKDYDLPKPTAVSPPKLISSIPTFKKCNPKRKSFVGLLETNIDFTETNLDEFVKNKSLDKSLTISINESPMCDIVENKNCDPRSPSKDFLRTPIQICQKVGEVDFNNTLDECETTDQVPEIEDCNTAESLLKLVDDKHCVESEELNVENPQHIIVDIQNPEENDEVILKENDEVVLKEHDEVFLKENDEVVLKENEMKQEIDVNRVDAHIVEVSEILNENIIESEDAKNEINTEQQMAEIVEDLIGNTSVLTTEESNDLVPFIDNSESKEPIIDLTADVQEFDKKLTKIIHENNENFSFKKIISKEFSNDKSMKRTPMKDRNQITEPKWNKLKVSDKPRKLNYDVSKIPVFKDKNGIKTKVQCENTPPADINVRRRKKSQQPRWDSDKTLVI